MDVASWLAQNHSNWIAGIHYARNSSDLRKSPGMLWSWLKSPTLDSYALVKGTKFILIFLSPLEATNTMHRVIQHSILRG